MTSIEIDGIPIAGDNLCYIIAEVGINHNGDVNIAKKLIDYAVIAGADAVKFQTYTSSELMSPVYSKQYAPNQYDLSEYELGPDELATVAEYCASQKITFLSSPFDPRSLDLLLQIGVPAIKIASGEITNIPLLRRIARAKLPVIMSTGLASLCDIESAIKIIRDGGVNDIVLLHCISEYPAPLSSANLRAIQTLENVFRVPVGFSDHTTDFTAAIIALSLGACVIEKHLTYSRDAPGPDHASSLNPSGFERYVHAIRRAELALGDGAVGNYDLMTGRRNRRSIVAAADIRRGEIIYPGRICMMRPETGIKPKHAPKIIGMRAGCDIPKGTPIKWDMLENSHKW